MFDFDFRFFKVLTVMNLDMLESVLFNNENLTTTKAWDAHIDYRR